MSSKGRHGENGSVHKERGLSLREAQSRCRSTIEDAYQSDRATLVSALPGMGKSHGAVKAAARTGTPITLLTMRGNKEQYDQVEEWCGKYDLSCRRLPSAYEECPTLAGEHGRKWARKVRRKYSHGAAARELHAGLDMPCTEDGACPYSEAWDFQTDDFDVLIGHYTHCHVGSAVEDRVVVVDEFPGDDFLHTLSPAAVTQFLQDTNPIPFGDFSNLLQDRRETGPRREALSWYDGRGMDVRDGETVVEDETGESHALAPLAALTLLKATDLGNEWEHAPLGCGQVGVYDKGEGEVHLLQPPSFESAAGLVCLDGTPTNRLWELVLGGSLKQRQVLTEAERREYVLHTQDLRIVQTTESIDPYSSGEYVNPKRDAALLHKATQKHDTTPAVITSKSALDQLNSLDGAGVSPKDSTYYGNVKGSNRLGGNDVGIVLGSPHRGDRFVERWAALAGETTTVDRGPGESYGDFGDEVLYHMRECEVLQAVFRFARQGDGATVYVHTSALPDWVPVLAGPDECEVRKRGRGERDIIEALSTLGSARASEIVEEIEKSVSIQWVREIGTRLAAEGVIQKYDDPNHQQANLYKLPEDEDVNRFGEVTLPAVSEENPKLSRTRSLYGGVSGFEEQRSLSQQDDWREEIEKIRARDRRQRRQIETEVWRRGGEL